MGSAKDKKKRIRRTREDIESDERCSAAGRRESRKWSTSWDKYHRPVARLNFVWQCERLAIISATADEIDMTTEAYIRHPVYVRCVEEIQNGYKTRTNYKRVLSGRYFQRVDVKALSWRWREPNVKLADEVAQKLGLDFKTFMDLAAFEYAFSIAEEIFSNVVF